VIESRRRIKRIDIDTPAFALSRQLSVSSPVQASWLGYLNTMALETIDYRLTDVVLDPREGDQLYDIVNDGQLISAIPRQ
jgi:hypothetical protein